LALTIPALKRRAKFRSTLRVGIVTTALPFEACPNVRPGTLIVGMRFDVGQSSIKECAFSIRHGKIIGRQCVPNAPISSSRSAGLRLETLAKRDSSIMG
jgi:hypothetical protein